MPATQSPIAPVWQRARRAIPVGRPPRALRRVPVEVARMFAPAASAWRAALRAMRPHQWLKNLLVFVPMLTAHRWGDAACSRATLVAFVAFGLCASGAYVANDLFDLAADRRHPRKRLRPIAAGALPLTLVAAAAPLLALAGWRSAPPSTSALGAVLAAYFVVTLAYSWVLKRYVLLDTMTLAGLYTTRASSAAPRGRRRLSFWLLAFSVFLFLSLGMVKRYTELQAWSSRQRRSGARPRLSRVDDIDAARHRWACASGTSRVLVFALYIDSPAVLEGYPRIRRDVAAVSAAAVLDQPGLDQGARGRDARRPGRVRAARPGGHVMLAAMALIVVAAGPL